MSSDYDWSLPSLDDSSGGWSSSGGYDLTSSGESSSFSSPSSDNSGGFNFSDDDWYVDSAGGSSTDVDTSYMSDIWGWVKSDMGVGVLGGAASIATKLWLANKANEMKNSGASAANHDGLEIAKLRDARVGKHNESINRPMDMGLVNLKRT